MLKKLLGSVFVLALALLFHANPANAALTLSANAVTGDGALTLQGTSVNVMGNALFSGKAGLNGSPIDANRYVNQDLTIAPGATTYGIFDSLVSTTNASVEGLLAGASTTTATGTTPILVGGGFQANNNGAGTVSNIKALFGDADNFTTGTITTARGVQGQIGAFGGAGTIVNGMVLSGTALNFSPQTITNLYGLNFSSWSNTGTITNSYGIYMDTSIDLGSTLKYAIYSSSTSQSYLQGNLGIGTATPGAKLDVTGHVASSGSAPTPSVTGAGYSGASLGAGSTDTKGTITATVGAAAGTLIATFQAGYTSAPVCTVTPNTATAQVDVIKMYSTTSTSALTLNFVATPTGGSETWSYHCIQ